MVSAGSVRITIGLDSDRVRTRSEQVGMCSDRFDGFRRISTDFDGFRRISTDRFGWVRITFGSDSDRVRTRSEQVGMCSDRFDGFRRISTDFDGFRRISTDLDGSVRIGSDHVRIQKFLNNNQSESFRAKHITCLKETCREDPFQNNLGPYVAATFSGDPVSDDISRGNCVANRFCMRDGAQVHGTYIHNREASDYQAAIQMPNKCVV